MSLQSSSMPQERFLRIATNLIYKSFLEASRDEAKKLFRDIEEGKRMPLVRVQMEDDSEVRFDVTLDNSLYDGRLNFTGFRNSLTVLVKNLHDTLENDEQALKVFRDNDNPNNMMFGVLGITEEEGRVNVLALGADTSPNAEAAIHLQLMFLDKDQFRQQAESNSDESVG